LFGLRAEESSKRAARGKIDYNKRYKTWRYKPIFNWLEWEIWEHINTYKLPVSELYDEGFSRLGCVVCPYLAGRKTMGIYRNRWPKIYYAFEKAMLFIFNNGKPNGLPWREATFEEFLNNWYRGK